jgi:hypothetical protein
MKAALSALAFATASILAVYGVLYAVRFAMMIHDVLTWPGLQ